MMELTRALEVISLIKDLVRRCQFKRKSKEDGSHFVTDYRQVITVLQSFVMNRFDICRQSTTLLAIIAEKDMHVHNHEHVPLRESSCAAKGHTVICLEMYNSVWQQSLCKCTLSLNLDRAMPCFHKV